MKKFISISSILCLFPFSACSRNIENPQLDDHTNTTSWTIITQNDLGTKYSGFAEVTGEVIMKSRYVGEPVPHISLNEDELKKLPKMESYDEFYLNGEEAGLLSEHFKKYEKMAVTVTVTAITIPSEGSPSLKVVDFTIP